MDLQLNPAGASAKLGARMDQSDQSETPRNLFLLCLLLGAVTLATYWPVGHHGFVNYDDPDYVTANEVVQRGLTPAGVSWAFTTGHASNWHPLTWLSHMLDVQLYGLQPAGHHLTNVVFHALNAMLLLLLLHQMTRALWRSALVAALFALHPLHVESVAWVAERKDMLSTFFGLLSLLAYARYAQPARRGHPASSMAFLRSPAYWLAGLCLALGLMSKPMLVTWPFVMLLLDFWPLRRFELSTPNPQPSTLNFHLSSLQSLVLEKLPFFALAALSAAVTLMVQHGAMTNTELLPLGARVANALLAVTQYLQQTVWPANLAVFYPLPTSLPPGQLVAAGALLGGITALAVRWARRHPPVLVGWLWFLGTLVPVIGLVQVGAQARADRYTYLPLIGIFLAVSWSLPLLVRFSRGARWLVSIMGLAALLALAVTSRAQVQHWRDDRALCAHAAAVTPGNYMAWGGLGIVEVKAANWPAAMTNLTRAYEYAQAHHTERSVSYYLGVALQMQGKPKAALPYLEDCIVSAEIRPERDHRLGLSLMDAGRLPEAETAIRAALAAKPQNLDYQLGLAALYQAKGEAANAETAHRAACTSHPESALAAKAYGDFLISMAHRPAEAVVEYAAAVQLKPADAAYRQAYANALRRTGDFSAALAQLEAAFKISPPTVPELLDLADLFAQLGRPQRVLGAYNWALEREPDSVPALNNLAWLLATSPEDGVRNGNRAVTLAEKACTITEWKVAVLMGTLAAAYAEAGRFPEALAMADKAIAAAHANQQEDIAKRNTDLRERYRTGQPYREK